MAAAAAAPAAAAATSAPLVELSKVGPPQEVRLIQQLDEEDRGCIFKMIDTMLTKKKFKDFFQQQLGSSAV